MASLSVRARTGIAALALSSAVGGAVWFATSSAGASQVPSDPGSSSSTPTTAPGAPGAPKAPRRNPIADVLAKLVANGTITQSQADAITAELGKELPAGGPHGRGPGGRGPAGPGRPGMKGGAPLDAVATALGMTVQDLRTALQGGKTIAAVAADKKVSVDTVVNAIVTAEKAKLDQAVKDGTLTQAQEDQHLADAKQHATDLVNGTFPGPKGGPGPFGGKPGDRHGGGAPASTTTTTA